MAGYDLDKEKVKKFLEGKAAGKQIFVVQLSEKPDGIAGKAKANFIDGPGGKACGQCY